MRYSKLSSSAGEHDAHDVDAVGRAARADASGDMIRQHRIRVILNLPSLTSPPPFGSDMRIISSRFPISTDTLKQIVVGLLG